MRLVYKIERPKKLIKFYQNDQQIEFKIGNEISESELDGLERLMCEGHKAIKDDITQFAKSTLIEKSPNKEKMNFRIGRAFCKKELIGYSIGYCILDKIDEFYLDVVYISGKYRKKGIGFHLALNIIKSITDIESIKTVKMITQDENEGGKKLIEKIIIEANK